MSEPTVEITHREKLFPEEDYEYEGTVNGKEWEAFEQMGFGASTSVDAEEDLTEAELDAVFEAIRNY